MPYRETNIREQQDGFWPDRGCIDQIFTLRKVLEQRHVDQRSLVSWNEKVCR